LPEKIDLVFLEKIHCSLYAIISHVKFIQMEVDFRKAKVSFMAITIASPSICCLLNEILENVSAPTC
jgi:hypothetical protein